MKDYSKTLVDYNDGVANVTRANIILHHNNSTLKVNRQHERERDTQASITLAQLIKSYRVTELSHPSF